MGNGVGVYAMNNLHKTEGKTVWVLGAAEHRNLTRTQLSEFYNSGVSDVVSTNEYLEGFSDFASHKTITHLCNNKEGAHALCVGFELSSNLVIHDYWLSYALECLQDESCEQARVLRKLWLLNMYRFGETHKIRKCLRHICDHQILNFLTDNQKIIFRHTDAVTLAGSSKQVIVDHGSNVTYLNSSNLGSENSKLQIGLLGKQNSYKLPELVVAALNKFARENQRELIVVTTDPTVQNYQFENSIKLKIVKNVDDDAFASIVASVDILIHLRNPTFFEASGPVDLAIKLGTPVICSDIGWYSGLPNTVIKVPLGINVQGLAAAVCSKANKWDIDKIGKVKQALTLADMELAKTEKRNVLAGYENENLLPNLAAIEFFDEIHSEFFSVPIDEAFSSYEKDPCSMLLDEEMGIHQSKPLGR